MTKRLPLKLYLLDINSHNKAILEFFVAGAGSQYFSLVNHIDLAEVFITDFDFPGAEEHWQAEIAPLEKPGMILAMNQPELEGVHWIPKPITSETLIRFAETASEEVSTDSTQPDSAVEQEHSVDPLDHSKINSRSMHPATAVFRNQREGVQALSANDPDSVVAIASGNTAEVVALEHPQSVLVKAVEVDEEQQLSESAADRQTAAESPQLLEDDLASAQDIGELDEDELDEDELDRLRENSPVYTRQKLSPQEAKKRWEQLCGIYPDLTDKELKDPRTRNFNCESHLQGGLIAALRLAKQTQQVVQVKYEPWQFYVLYDEYLLLSDLHPQSDEFAELCVNMVRPGQINLQIMDAEKSSEIRHQLHNDKIQSYDLEAFTWTTCLLSSRGRVPMIFEYDRHYLLKYWPNFTRMENFPFSMKIAAMWHDRPCRLTEMADILDIPQRYVIAFFNAAMGLSLFEQNPDKVHRRLTETAPAKERGGILSRLFGRLIGGTGKA